MRQGEVDIVATGSGDLRFVLRLRCRGMSIATTACDQAGMLATTNNNWKGIQNGRHVKSMVSGRQLVHEAMN